jgi:hypothetical protein
MRHCGAKPLSSGCHIAFALARHWSLPIVLHPLAGHEIAMDDPAWLVRQCTRWVGGIAAPAR